MSRAIDWKGMFEQYEKDARTMREAEEAADAVKLIFAAVYDTSKLEDNSEPNNDEAKEGT